MKERKSVGGLDISLVGFSELISRVLEMTERGRRGYVCFANSHMVVEAHRNPEIREAVNGSTFTTADGVPLLKSLNHLHETDQERVAGMDVLPALLGAAAESDASVYFYGSTGRVLDAIARRIKRDLPGLRVAGMHSPPFGPISESRNAEILNEINRSDPQILFVGLGCPKQELWMAENTGKIGAVLLGVGAAFETYAGTKRMAPQWIRDNGIEWIYRLLLEPKRLFKRYLITNSIFVWLVFKDLLRRWK